MHPPQGLDRGVAIAAELSNWREQSRQKLRSERLAYPSKRMAGQYGNVTRTVQTLTVVRVDAERGLLLVKGSVPGADGGHIIVRRAAKAPVKKGA